MERIPRTLPSTGLSPAHRLPPALLPRRPSGALAGLPAVRLRRPLPAGAGPLDRLAGPAPPAAAAGCAASPFPAVSLGARKMPGVEGPGAELAPAGRGLAARPWRAARAGRNLCQRPAQGNLLPGLELALPGTDPGARCLGHGASEDAQGGLRVSAAAGLAGGPARTHTPCALPLDARLLGHPQHRLSRPPPRHLNACVAGSPAGLAARPPVPAQPACRTVQRRVRVGVARSERTRAAPRLAVLSCCTSSCPQRPG